MRERLPWLALCAHFAVASCKPAPHVTAEKGERKASVGARGPVMCLENEDGCVMCKGRQDQSPFLEPDQSRPVICDPKDAENCVEFCSAVTAECALPWIKGAGCLFGSQLEWRRALFQQEAADRPEVIFVGRVVDEGGRRIENAAVRVWLVREATLLPLLDVVTGKDGALRLPLRTGPWNYALRLAHPGRSSEIVDRLLPDRSPERVGASVPARVFRLAPEVQVRGRVVDEATGGPVPGALVQAFRSRKDSLDVAEARAADDGSFTLGGLEARRYTLRVAHFGWRTPERPEPAQREPVSAPASKITLKLARTAVMRGLVVDADGVPEPDAFVRAVLSGPPSPAQASPQMAWNWSTDADGKFQWDGLPPGTYYLWARRGEMQVYPPTKKEIGPGQEVEVRLQLSHKGARIAGQVRRFDDAPLPSPTHATLIGRSPVWFPRNQVAPVGRDGKFLVTGVLPGRYEISIGGATQRMAVSDGQREVEVPVEPGVSLQLKDTLVVRPQLEE